MRGTWTAAVAAVLLAATLTACGSDNEPDGERPPSSQGSDPGQSSGGDAPDDYQDRFVRYQQCLRDNGFGTDIEGDLNPGSGDANTLEEAAEKCKVLNPSQLGG
ncbi:hypothetical protein ACF08M_13150 [Streptomyces sp. NPDC015032]|uniref:hypothetical protein n=1 Tax=Streptomyces sp. NPDC015032 TaxID=3364937 RepID=UPI0036FBD494